MRVRDDDRSQRPECPRDVRDGVGIDVGDHVPHDIAVGRLEHERPLADGELFAFFGQKSAAQSGHTHNSEVNWMKCVPWAPSKRTRCADPRHLVPMCSYARMIACPTWSTTVRLRGQIGVDPGCVSTELC